MVAAAFTMNDSSYDFVTNTSRCTNILEETSSALTEGGFMMRLFANDATTILVGVFLSKLLIEIAHDVITFPTVYSFLGILIRELVANS